MTDNWEPPYELEERIKYALVPPSLYIRRLAAKELRKGERELRLLPFLVDRTKASIDVGANKGVYTYFLGRLTTKVHAFEPNPKIFRILNRSLPDNVSTYQVALSNQVGSADLLVPGSDGRFSNQGASLSQIKVQGPHQIVHVQAQTLDHYNFSNVGFIKIDVEGYEKEVLEGAQQTIEREKPVLLIEMEEKHTKEPIEQSIQFVLGMGYMGMFLEAERLRPITHFEPERNHRSANNTQDEYVFNFVFFPK
ncbi:MAG: hypothetical protein CL566_06720 [Alphaproteobacteria bacterium]|nr:hypothetical protein [Alphaproteobacteria bacterium]|tara:strand:+ start:1554 stop:2306 length:753 start_codon:yes stop_codon:yes gene_type:complete